MLADINLSFDRDQLVVKTEAQTRPDDKERIVYLRLRGFKKQESTLLAPEVDVNIRVSADQLAYIVAKADQEVQDWARNRPTQEL